MGGKINNIPCHLIPMSERRLLPHSQDSEGGCVIQFS